MKVKATDEYELNNVQDSVLGRIPKKGEVFEVDENRFFILNGHSGIKDKDGNEIIFVEKIEEIKEAVAPTPKKENAKKKTTKK